jgi:hypothetical protein
MSSVTKVTKILDLDLTDVPRDKRAEVKREVGDYLVNEILRSTERGSSPVQGEGKFKILEPDYAKDEKGGRRTANLQLEGDLMEALKSKNRTGNKIEVGIEGSQAPKADGHNQISGEAKAWARSKKKPFPKRRFIPDSSQDFTNRIKNGINSIITEYKREEILEDEELFEFESTATSTLTTTPDGTPDINTSIEDLFSDDAIEALLQDAIRRRG